MQVKRYMIAAMAPLGLLAAAPAAAAEIDFRVCDGYPAPAGGADGTQQTWLWGLIDDAQPKAVSHEEAAIAACDRALADPLLLPGYGVRRALLLRAKAVNQLILARTADALATLDQADAVRLPEPFFAQRYAEGNRLLRAYADYRDNRLDAARAEIAAVEKGRRYAAWTMGMTYSLQLAYDHGWPQLHAAMLGQVATEPAAIGQTFWASFYYQDFDEALRLGPQISYTLPQGRKDSRIKGIDDHPYEVITRRADRDGAMAYALAATGHADQAAAAIARARADLTAARTPPGASDADPAEARTDLQRRQMAADEGGTKIDLWEAAIALRARAATMTVETLGPAVKEAGVNKLPIMIDMIGRLKPADPVSQSIQHRLITTLEQRRDTEMEALAKFDFDALNRALPRPGVAAGPSLKGAGDGLVFGDANGFYSKKEPDSPYLNIRYGNQVASQDAIDDLTLLAAATYARKAGKDSFMVDSRMLVTRTIRTIRYYGASSTSSNGAEVRLRILPLNAAELTPAQEPMRWRLIRVQDVFDQLVPLYPAPAARR